MFARIFNDHYLFLLGTRHRYPAPNPIPMAKENKLVLHFASVPKPDNDYQELDGRVQYRKSEDFINRKVLQELKNTTTFEQPFCIGLSDGAGGDGIYAAEWAQTLVEHLSPQRVLQTTEDVNDWIETFYQQFGDEMIKKTAFDSFKRNKFLEEGALSTLLAIWIEKKEDDFQLKAFAWGDSCLFIWDKGSLSCFPIQQLGDFSSHTQLINYKDLLEGNCALKEVDSLKDKIVLLASDAISQYLYAGFLLSNNATEEDRKQLAPVLEKNGKMAAVIRAMQEKGSYSFPDFLQQIKDNLESEERFQDYTYALYKEGVLLKDDYSLIWLEIQ